MDAKAFPSKVDWWLGLVLLLLPLSPIAILVTAVLTGESEALLTGAGTLVFILLLYGVLVLPMRYVVEQEQLVVRFGLIRARIPYAQIRSIKPRFWLISAPALSLDRLHVDHGKPLQTYISPKDKAGFLAAVAERAPHLRLEGNELLPADPPATP